MASPEPYPIVSRLNVPPADMGGLAAEKQIVGNCHGDFVESAILMTLSFSHNLRSRFLRNHDDTSIIATDVYMPQVRANPQVEAAAYLLTPTARA